MGARRAAGRGCDAAAEGYARRSYTGHPDLPTGGGGDVWVRLAQALRLPSRGGTVRLSQTVQDARSRPARRKGLLTAKRSLPVELELADCLTPGKSPQDGAQEKAWS